MPIFYVSLFIIGSGVESTKFTPFGSAQSAKNNFNRLAALVPSMFDQFTWGSRENNLMQSEKMLHMYKYFPLARVVLTWT